MLHCVSFSFFSLPFKSRPDCFCICVPLLIRAQEHVVVSVALASSELYGCCDWALISYIETLPVFCSWPSYRSSSVFLPFSLIPSLLLSVTFLLTLPLSLPLSLPPSVSFPTLFSPPRFLSFSLQYSPPLIPPRGEVNAADAFDIGSFDEEDTKGIKVHLSDHCVSMRWLYVCACTRMCICVTIKDWVASVYVCVRVQFCSVCACAN